jgi:ribonuclease VapC
LIVIDSSAVFAVILNEPEAQRFPGIMLSNQCLMGAPTRVEVHLVATSRGPGVSRDVDALFELVDLDIVPFDARMAEIARDAFDRYGPGRRGLNSGDCLSYAVARAIDAPLLFKGLDFAGTDVASAVG